MAKTIADVILPIKGARNIKALSDVDQLKQEVLWLRKWREKHDHEIAVLKREVETLKMEIRDTMTMVGPTYGDLVSRQSKP